jgi:hypothetical protein
VGKNALDGGQTADFIERILEIGVVAVELGKRATLAGANSL